MSATCFGRTLVQRSGMASPEPPRNLTVWLLGAGVSSSFGLPNTAALLRDVQDRLPKEVTANLKLAYEFLYPDAEYDHFMPDVVDFFSSLSAFVGVGQGWPGTGLKNARELLRQLRRHIAKMLIDEVKAIPDSKLRVSHFLQEVVRPGNVIVTTNWDPLVECFASVSGLPIRLASRSGHFPLESVSLLKLHGSVDWTLGADATKDMGIQNYMTIGELQNSARQHTPSLPEDLKKSILRIRSKRSNMWQKVSSRTAEPLLVTMVTGKQDELGPLRPVWRDAYSALGRASHINVAGYSLPADDVEVRTLLRAGIMRGRTRPALKIIDPSPATHARFRALVSHRITSDYGGVPRSY